MTEDAPQKPAALFDLSGQVALVTGASRGLGWAMARTLAAAGATVMLNSRGEAGLAEKRDALRGWGLAGDMIAADVSQKDIAAHLVRETVARHGRLDILISNAAGTVRKPLTEQSYDDWEKVIDVGISAGWRLAREAAPIMIGAGYGRMIFTSSIMAAVTRPGVAGYTAAKSGLEGLVRALAVELAPAGITVNALAPGYFLTDGNSGHRAENPDFEPWISKRTPMGRWGRPEEIGTTALYLASPASAYATGNVYRVDGGLTAAI